MRRIGGRAAGGALVLAGALAAAGPAVAVSLSMNEVVLAPGTTLETCKAAARGAVAGAGLGAMPESPGSVFGEGPQGLLAAVYCLPRHGIAMVAVAGQTSGETRPLLARLLADLAPLGGN